MRLLSRLRARLRNRRFDADLAEELRFHDEMKRQELEAAGVDPSVDEYRFMREQVKSFTGLVAHAPIYPARVRAEGSQ
jgi:hypothetical protein